MMKKCAAVLATALIANGAVAYEAGDFFVRAGTATVAPNDSSDGIAIPALDVAPIPGTDAEANSNTQLGLTLNYMFTDSIGIELLASTPFTHEITANLDGHTPGLRVPAGKTKQLPPTLSVVYYPFASSDSAIQPYVGLGLNYTIMFDDKADPALEALTGTLAGVAGPVPLELEVDDSFGIALQVGADYALNDNWHVNATVRWIDIDTEAEFTSALGSTITVDDVQIDPMVYQLNIGYKF